ncbi:MAG: hydrogenase maturation protease [Candidatus Omnitrophica bacterium]|nr:hydrogenase maturation protease [Candidatus Omnitrophota bacterium]
MEINQNKNILIVGVGSILKCDDAVGIRVVESLEKDYGIGRSLEGVNITLHAGDISGLDLIKIFPGYDKIIIIDAAEMSLSPGEIRVFGAGEIVLSDAFSTNSTHGMSLKETLLLARNLDIPMKNIKLIGIQPRSVDFSLEMSSLITKKIPEIITKIKILLNEFCI